MGLIKGPVRAVWWVSASTIHSFQRIYRKYKVLTPLYKEISQQHPRIRVISFVDNINLLSYDRSEDLAIRDL